MIGTAAIAALVHHREQAAGGQRRELLQRLADERQIGVDLRWPRRDADPGQAGLRQHALHHAVVHVQLRGRWCRRSTSRRGSSAGSAPRCQAASPWRAGLRPVVSSAAAMTPAAAQEPLTEQMAGSARPHQWQCGPGGRSRSAGAACVARGRHREPAPADHRLAARVNRDASLSSAAPASGVHPRGMPPPATMARLVAPPGAAGCLAPGLRGAVAGAVDLTAVAATANDHLAAAAGAQEQTARYQRSACAVSQTRRGRTPSLAG